MATITFSALTGHHEQTPGRPYAMTVVELFGEVLGRTRIEAKSLEQVRASVTAFGNGIAAQHPGESFTVSVSAARGSRNPGGFDAANRANGLGQEAWMRTIVTGGQPAPA